MVRRVYPFAARLAGSDLAVTTRLSDFGGAAASIVDTQSFDLEQAEGEHFVSVFRRGRFYDIAFSTDEVGQAWSLDGYMVEVNTGGYR